MWSPKVSFNELILSLLVWQGAPFHGSQKLSTTTSPNPGTKKNLNHGSVAFSAECNIMASLIFEEIWINDSLCSKLVYSWFYGWNGAWIIAGYLCFLHTFSTKSELQRWKKFSCENRERRSFRFRPINRTCVTSLILVRLLFLYEFHFVIPQTKILSVWAQFQLL